MRNLLLILLFLGTINCSNKQESSNENKIKIALIYGINTTFIETLINDINDYKESNYPNITFIELNASEDTVKQQSQKEVFGPVLFIKRVKDFESGLKIMNDSEFANGSVIYTQSGYYAREFSKRTHGGMVGINVGIPVPIGIFGFTGHKDSFFGDLHAMGTDGVRFFTEQKTVTAHWPEIGDSKIKGSWDGMI